LALGGTGMVAAGMAAEFLTTILPQKAGLDVALPWWFPNPVYVLFWGGVAAFAVGMAMLVVEVSAEEVFVKRGDSEEEKKKTLVFGGN